MIGRNAHCRGVSGPVLDLLAQRSEQARVRLVIGALLALVALTLVRRLAGGLVMSSPVFWWTLGLLASGWRTKRGCCW